ncbi:MAG: hypothetical protein J6Z41_04295 [Prevotella sp.]|nr:hypothetical protein [Prevotella sp.]
MFIIRNRWLPPRRYTAINLFGVLFCRRNTKISDDTINHERIHTAQLLEMGVVFFYIWYVIEWLIRLPMRGNAYRNISFEREAYLNMYNDRYLRHRRHYSWLKYLRRK